jgi:hypothetical protein
VTLGIGPEQHDRRCRAATFNLYAIADGAVRKNGFLLFEFGGGIVATLDIRAAEAGKLDGFPTRGQGRRFAVRPFRRDLEGRPQDTGIDHLRRHRPFPDQVVDLEAVGVEDLFELTGREPKVGRTNRFVRFLRVLHTCLITTRTVVVLATEHLANHARRFVQCLIRERRRIGAVIGDQTFHLIVADFDALEQALRHLHRAFGGEPEFATRLLRQRGCREWWRGTLNTRLLFD